MRLWGCGVVVLFSCESVELWSGIVMDMWESWSCGFVKLCIC